MKLSVVLVAAALVFLIVSHNASASRALNAEAKPVEPQGWHGGGGGWHGGGGGGHGGGGYGGGGHGGGGYGGGRGGGGYGGGGYGGGGGWGGHGHAEEKGADPEAVAQP